MHMFQRQYQTTTIGLSDSEEDLGLAESSSSVDIWLTAFVLSQQPFGIESKCHCKGTYHVKIQHNTELF